MDYKIYSCKLSYLTMIDLLEPIEFALENHEDYKYILN